VIKGLFDILHSSLIDHITLRNGLVHVVLVCRVWGT